MYTRGDESMMYRPEQKGYVLRIVQPTMRSTLSVYDIRPLIARYMLQVTCYPCSFLCSESSGTPMHARLRSLYPLSTFDAAHMRKNTRLSTPAQLQCLCSEVGEPGNKASAILSIIISNLCIPQNSQSYVHVYTSSIQLYSSRVMFVAQFWGISPRNSTLFTRWFLPSRHDIVWGGHETRVPSG